MVIIQYIHIPHQKHLIKLKNKNIMFKKGIINYISTNIIVPDKTDLKSYIPLDSNSNDLITNNNSTSDNINYSGNRYITFSGNGYATIPSIPTLTNYTINAYVKAVPNSNEGAIIGLRKNNWIRLWFDGGGNYYIRHYNGTTECNIPVGITPNEWDFLSATKSGNTLTIYKNGQYVNSDTISGSIAAGTNDYIGFFESSSEYFNGSISDLSIFTRALTPTEILTLYNDYRYKLSLSTLASDANLIAHYEFKDNVNDRKGTYSATSVSNATYNSNEFGKINNSGFFSGNTSCKAYNFTTELTTNETYKSVLCWIKPLNYVNRQGIIGNKNSSGVGWSLRLDQNTGYLSFDNGISGTGLNSTTSINKNMWSQVGYTLDNLTKNCKLFVNGNEVASGTINNFTGTSSNGVIGAEYDDGTYPFIGYIDEIGIFNKSLSSGEINDIFLHQSTGETLSSYFNLNKIDILVVAGGGGGANTGSGGGAGGFLEESNFIIDSNSVYTIGVGAGGAGGNGGNGGATGNNFGSDGSNSSFSTLTSIGGGGGLSHGSSAIGRSGGSGGGAPILLSGTSTGGLGTQGQGNNGGAGYVSSMWAGTSGGGGGAGSAGSNGSGSSGGGNGGAGKSSSISGTATYYAGGGGGGEVNGSYSGSGGIGGGGSANNNAAGNSGIANTGGGGAGGSFNGLYYNGGNGGSGIVIIRYLTTDLPTMVGGTKTTNGNYTIHTFTSSGTFNKV